jgi:lysophospholipase
LRDELWAESFQAGLLLPANILKADEYPEVVVDLFAKDAAGFDNTVVDAYGRLLSYQLLKGDDGGDDIRMSGLTSLSNFTNYNVPYPIITALGVDNSYAGQCYPTLNATQYEFHPYEYGSWDAGVSAFASTEFMGTDLTNGRPTKPGKCIHHYDNIGYIFGTSSDVFPAACQTLRPDPSSGADLSNFLQSLVSRTKRPAFQDAFGIYPNPFYRLPQSRTVNTQRLLTLADGGLAGQNVPLWPLLQPARALDVIIATDNSADTPDNLPNGTEIHQTYLSARAAGLSTMPYVPPPDDFVAQNLSSRAVFFGCDSLASTVLLVWLPNVAYSFASNQPTSKVRYSRDETARMIANGNAIAEQGGQEGWSVCLACAVKAKDGLGALPPPCRACFDRYCYRGAGPV